MGFLDRFKQEKDLDSGLDLPEDDDGLDLDEPSADDELGDEPTGQSVDKPSISSDPAYPGTEASSGGDEDLHQDVQLVLEKLDTVKSQLQHVQSKLDRLEAEHGDHNSGRRNRR